jgi:hypothetical protein
MKHYVVKAAHNPNELAIIGVQGFTPKDMICLAPLMPDGSVCTDVSLISLVQEEQLMGEPKVVAVVDADKLAKKEADIAVKAQVRELLKYKEQRTAEYPTQMELLEAIMEEKEGRPEKMQAVLSKRSEVRNKYPKGLK